MTESGPMVGALIVGGLLLLGAVGLGAAWWFGQREAGPAVAPLRLPAEAVGCDGSSAPAAVALPVTVEGSAATLAVRGGAGGVMRARCYEAEGGTVPVVLEVGFRARASAPLQGVRAVLEATLADGTAWSAEAIAAFPDLVPAEGDTPLQWFVSKGPPLGAVPVALRLVVAEVAEGAAEDALEQRRELAAAEGWSPLAPKVTPLFTAADAEASPVSAQVLGCTVGEARYEPSWANRAHLGPGRTTATRATHAIVRATLRLDSGPPLRDAALEVTVLGAAGPLRTLAETVSFHGDPWTPGEEIVVVVDVRHDGAPSAATGCALALAGVTRAG